MQARLAGVSGISDITFCFQPPAANANNNTNVRYDNRPEDEHWGVNMKAGDVNFLSVFGIKLVAGRNFFASDTTREVLVNETFVKKLNLKSPEEAIGKKVFMNGDKKGVPISGVVKDFYTYSFHDEIPAIAIFPDNNSYTRCAVKIETDRMQAALKSIEKIWNETYPDYLYEYQFLDESVAKFYELDMTILKLIQGFAAIAIIIGSLGLYGLVSFMAVRKTKEIGVRKVLGASMANILWLFGKEFTRLLLIAFVIAAPVAWWAMSHYLEDFKNRISLHPWIFLLAILCTFLIAAISVVYRSVRAALANPVTSLRTE